MILPTIDLEKKLWEKGYTYVCGIDEVGRGPLAGPVVIGCVVLENPGQVIEGVRDSKTVSQKKREYFYEKIKQESSGWSIGIVSNDDIDNLGLSQSIRSAIEQGLNNLKENFSLKADYILIDGGIAQLVDYEMQSINKGDNLHYSIAAASILAKVERDRIMCEYAKKYPNYGFEKHVGYGTKMHMEALKKHGPCDIHRKSFKPIAKFF